MSIFDTDTCDFFSVHDKLVNLIYIHIIFLFSYIYIIFIHIKYIIETFVMVYQ